MTMVIKVLGSGCRNCVILDRVVREAVADLGLDASVEKVEDYQAIMDYSVMTTPALVIDDQVILAGRVPTPRALRTILTDAAAT
jgi:small redox-active disulfide protein 2